MNWKERVRKHRSHRRKGDTAELSASLAPLEELKPEVHQPPTNDGAIRVGGGEISVPKDFMEENRKGASIFRLEPAVIVLLALALVFIAFVAWQISLMPPAAR